MTYPPSSLCCPCPRPLLEIFFLTSFLAPRSVPFYQYIHLRSDCMGWLSPFGSNVGFLILPFPLRLAGGPLSKPDLRDVRLWGVPSCPPLASGLPFFLEEALSIPLPFSPLIFYPRACPPPRFCTSPLTRTSRPGIFSGAIP